MSAEPLFRDYLSKVESAYRAGNATEHTYRPYLKELLEKLGNHITATNEPKRVACGAPDYVITREERSGPATIGYVEAKDIPVSLNDTVKTDQLNRYRRALDNLVLTDYLEFRWFLRGEHHMTARLAEVRNGRIVADHDGMRQVEDLLVSFLGQSAEIIRSPRHLAERMARLTHMIRDLTVESFKQQAASAMLTGLYDSFKQVLIPDLSESDFADMFAQTLAYGLFAARTRHSGPEPFSREHAAREIPKTNPFLRRLFGAITGPDLDDEPFAGFVDDLTHLLARADMAAILADFGRRTHQDDPIIHFYETFLTAYDPKLRELRGVYYTPEPVVSYIVRSVDAILKRDFGLAEGLASDALPPDLTPYPPLPQERGNQRRVLLLDPACGTGTFLYKVIDLIRERFARAGNTGMWSSYVGQHLLPRLFGFELLMAPYAMAHLKLGMQLAALDMDEAQRRVWAYDFAGDERLGVYLTNTLDEAAKQTERLKLGQYISDEANEAATIKRDDPVMVVLGNPPYSGHSANKGNWITNLLRGKDTLNGATVGNYFEVDGKPLGERNPKWLNDDYVKFLRFAQWRIERTGHGVLAFITNHGYLDNPTFRGMRQSLMASFDEIHVLNLHGNSKKKERAPDGGKDDNVFDIQQGVAIGVFIRRPGSRGATRHARVYHADLYGERAGKYAWLAENDLATTEWAEVQPHAPFYLFVPRDMDLAREYEQGAKLTDVAPVNSVGIVTARDSLTIQWTVDDVWNTVNAFIKLPPEEARQRYELGPDARDWQVALAQKDLKDSGPSQSHIVPILYRPFDVRETYYTGTSRGFQCMPRPEVMRHMLAGRNLSITIGRAGQVIDQGEWDILFCSRDITEFNLYRRGGNNLFPLYLYPDPSRPALIDDQPPSTAPGGRRPNLAPAFVRDFSARLGLAWVSDGWGSREAGTFGPEDVFDYMYAVFHAPEYRERYAEFLKTDFPRLPLTSDRDLFWSLRDLGAQLVALHLMERKAPAIPSYPIPGNNLVEKVRYTAPGGSASASGSPPSLGEGPGERASGRVWINTTQYFEGVPPEVWEFHVGGYQVCEKWLKDRKGRTLTYDDQVHYQQTVAALAETIRLMAAIDETIEDHGGWPLGGA